MRRYVISILLLLPFVLLLYSGSNSTRAFGLGSTFLISQSSGGEPGNALSESPSMAVGNQIVFASEATNLVVGDSNGQKDIFLREGSTTQRVSEVAGTGGNGASSKPEISDTGEWIVFQSNATNLVTQTTFITVTDIFLYNVNSQEIQLVTVTADGEPADGQSEDAYVTNNGQWVVFASSATNLVDSAPTGADRHIYLRDMVDNTTEVVSLDNNGQFADQNSETPSITQDGTKVLFVSLANLINDNTPDSCLNASGCKEVFIRNLTNQTTELVSVNSAGVPATAVVAGSQLPVMSANGRWVVFESLVEFDSVTNNKYDIYLRDRDTSTTTRISLKFNGSTTDQNSQFADISPSGEWLTFASQDPDLIENDSNGNVEDTFRYHNVTENPQPLKVVSVATGGQQAATEGSRQSSILDTGEQIAFLSFAEDMVPDEDFSGSDIFLYDLSIQVTPTPTVTGTPPTSTPSPTMTETPIESPTVTGTPPTSTPTSTPSVTGTPPTSTPTSTPTVTGTPPTSTPTSTPSNTPTLEGQAPSFTPTPTGTLPTVTGTPPTVTGTPPTVTGTPPTVTGTPPTVTGTPPTLTPGPGTPSITPTVDPNIYLPIIRR